MRPLCMVVSSEQVVKYTTLSNQAFSYQDGSELTRGFLHLVETGRSSISLRALAIIAARLNLPVSYFVDEAPLLAETADATIDQIEAAIAYSRYLRSKGKTREALEYALWTAQTKLIPGQ